MHGGLDPRCTRPGEATFDLQPSAPDPRTQLASKQNAQKTYLNSKRFEENQF